MSGSGDAAATAPESRLDVKRVRKEFPILERSVRGRPLVYLDNAASTQKPMSVIVAESSFYASRYANIHRGVHFLSQEATTAYEEVRGKARRLVNAAEDREIVFVRGTTEAINLVAQTFGRRRVGPGDEVLVSEMEHHSNIVPWQLLCEERGATVRVVPLDDDGDLVLDELDRLLGPKAKLLAVAHVSNALGTVNPLETIVKRAHAHGVPVVVDGAQAVGRGAVDVRAIGCDFYAFSGHKIYGPSGVGVLYGRADLFEAMPPYQGGGEMISTVRFEKSTYREIPYRFEAGTPNIAGVVGLGAAIDYLEGLGFTAITAHEADLLEHATGILESIPQVRIIGRAKERQGLVSFVVDGVHPHDLGTVLDMEGIAVRAGHHCAQPVMDRYGVPATVRASFAVYNTREEIDALAEGVKKAIHLLGC